MLDTTFSTSHKAEEHEQVSRRAKSPEEHEQVSRRAKSPEEYEQVPYRAQSPDAYRDKRFLVFGTGLSGIAAAELLIKNQIQLVLYDGKEDLDIPALRERYPVPIYAGTLPEEVLKEIDIAVLSPGVPTDLPLVNHMRELGIAIWGEIELAYVFSKGRVLAVTGTNGKTTTTALLGEIMKATFSDVQVVGNIGVPYTGIADQTTRDTVTVAEISSFQLETIHSFRPQVSAILNITPDHLNRHHTMEDYIAVKERIAENQTGFDTCVLNYEDPILRSFGEGLPAKVVYFSSARWLGRGVSLFAGEIHYANAKIDTIVCTTDELQLIGKHNYENVMAAIAMAVSFGAPMEVIRRVVKNFRAVEHRIEYVTTKRGVRFYNDSKGTNPDAAIQAIRAMKWPTLLIGGGYDKDADYREWIEAFQGKVKKFVLLGATREKIARTALDCGFPKEDILFADSMEEAVRKCYANAEPGDAVLLSPACASWGMFANYEERGRIFKDLVRELEE